MLHQTFCYQIDPVTDMFIFLSVCYLGLETCVAREQSGVTVLSEEAELPNWHQCCCQESAEHTPSISQCPYTFLQPG